MSKLKNKRKVIIIALLLIAVVCFILCTNLTITYAEKNAEDLVSICAKYTEELSGYFDGTKELTDYENYVDERFQVGSKFNKDNSAQLTTDEWLLEFIPKQLFEEKPSDYFYVGKAYGFYFDFDITTHTYFIYFLLHSIEINALGHLERTVRPLYYERYEYLVPLERPRLIHRSDDNKNHFEKYSTVETIYIIIN